MDELERLSQAVEALKARNEALLERLCKSTYQSSYHLLWYRKRMRRLLDWFFSHRLCSQKKMRLSMWLNTRVTADRIEAEIDDEPKYISGEI